MGYGVRDLATKQLSEEISSERFVDLRVIWLEHGDSNEVILDCGGLWDRRHEEWHGDSDNALVLRFQPAQYEAAYWWAGWMREYLAGGPRSEKYDRKWSMFNVGGRRGGKTDFIEKAMVTFAAAKPGRIVWPVSPTLPEAEEHVAVFERLVPPHWGHYWESKMTWRLAHGSKIEIRSSYNPASLKRGRVDLVGLNEAQNMHKRAWTFVRAPIADTGGLVMAAANPPDQPIGRWVLDTYDEMKAGKRNGVLFEFDPRLNPFVDHRALLDMKSDIGDKDYQRDVLGEFIEIGDLVWYAWSPRENIKPRPDVGNVSREFTFKKLGREFGYVIGIDLQLTPWMSAAIGEFFHDPERPDEPFLWITDEVFLEGTEHDLIDAIEEKGYLPHECALILDASAWWQDAERTKGRGSKDIFVNRGWRFCYRPDTKAKRNPLIHERVQATNGKMRNHSGRRALFSIPENYNVNRCLRLWENKNGIPNRRSEFAHGSDSVSYLIWRFWPRKLRRKSGDAIGYEKVRRRRSKRERDLDNL